jgi:hypothetical protein
MSDKQPNQAMPTSDKGGQHGVGERPDKAAGGGESSGGAYPNPHTGNPDPQGGFMGHGGQSRIDYSGTGAGSGDEDEDVGNENAVTGKD